MKDKEVRGLVLEKFYELRHKQEFVSLNQILPVRPTEPAQIINVCEQLAEHGLIQWKPIKALYGVIDGTGKITAAGVDVIDGDARAPFSIAFHDHSVTITESPGVIIGSGNSQSVTIDKRYIEKAIEQSVSSEGEKNEAKSILNRLVSNPTLWSILNGLFGSQ